jgi:hypothetical protein
MPISASQQFHIDIYNPPVQVGPNNFTSEEWNNVDSDYGFHRNGVRYCILGYREEFQTNLPAVFASSDDGLTWAELDAANRPHSPVAPQVLFFGITKAEGNGTQVVYDYFVSGTDTPSVAPGQWVNIQGALIDGFNGVFEVALVTVLTATTGTFTTNNTTTGIDSIDPNDHTISNHISGNVVAVIAEVPVQHYPTTAFTPNAITMSGRIQTTGSSTPMDSVFHYDGADTLSFVVTISGEIGVLSSWANGSVPIDQTTFYLYTFDLATGTWSANLTPGTAPFPSYGLTNGTNSGAVGVVRLTTGAWRLFFQGNPSDADGIVYTAEFGFYSVDYARNHQPTSQTRTSLSICTDVGTSLIRS